VHLCRALLHASSSCYRLPADSTREPSLTFLTADQGTLPTLLELAEQVSAVKPSTPQHVALRRPLQRAIGAASAARLAAAVLGRRGWVTAALAVLTAVRAERSSSRRF